MGYACPVCDDPQADAGHLANHVAFTAILGDDAHGAWLDEHVPGWGEMGEAELADALRDSVDETEFPQVFEDTVGGLSESEESSAERAGALFEDAEEGRAHDHAGHDHGGQRAHPPGGDGPGIPSVDPRGPTDEETAAILEEAREMTRAMRGAEEDDEGDTDGDETADSDVDTSDDGLDHAEEGGSADAVDTDETDGRAEAADTVDAGEGADAEDADSADTDGNENE